MHLYFLGTGAGVPSKKRNVSSYILDLSQERGSIWMFDCGEATQHQILHTTIKPGKLEKIFITHLHGDHIFGLPGLLGSRSFQGGRTPVDLYGPAGIKPFVHTALSISKTRLQYRLNIHEIDEGLIYEDEQFTIKAKRLDHGIASFAYRIIEKDKIGQLQPEKLKEAGIPPGPIYQKIKENPSVTLEDGTVIYRKTWLARPKKEKSSRYLVTPAITMSIFLLPGTLTCLFMNPHLARRILSWPTIIFIPQLCRQQSLPKKASVKKLILTHISSRYQDGDIERISNQIKGVFPNSIITHDFKRVDV